MGFVLEAAGDGTRLTETWEFLPAGPAMSAEKYGDRAAAEIEDRTRRAHAGIPATLAAIKGSSRPAESLSHAYPMIAQVIPTLLTVVALQFAAIVLTLVVAGVFWMHLFQVSIGRKL